MTNLCVSMFQQCCDNIIREAKASKALDYAVGYAQAGYSLWTEEQITTQALYLLNNITHWRGPVAKDTRATLKKLAESKTWR